MAFPSLYAPGVDPTTGFVVNEANAGNHRNNDFFDETKNEWFELVDATAEDWAGFYIYTYCSNTGFINIATGGLGSEVRLASMYNGNSSSGPGLNVQYIPIPVMSGTRLSLSHSGLSTSTVRAWVVGVKADDLTLPPYTKMDMGPINLDGGSSGYSYGVDLSPATVDAAKSAWTEISIAGTYSSVNNILQGDSLPHEYAYIGVQFQNVYQSPVFEIARLFDVAYGAVSSEVIVAENLVWNGNNNISANARGDSVYWLKWGRPAGDRISVRYQVETVANDAGARVHLFGLR